MTAKKTTVCRCPTCGSTEAYCDEKRSRYDLSFMTCPKCGYDGYADSWEVADDWLVDILLEEGASVPDTLPPLQPGQFYREVMGKIIEERLAR